MDPGQWTLMVSEGPCSRAPPSAVSSACGWEALPAPGGLGPSEAADCSLWKA